MKYLKWSNIRALGKIKYFNLSYVVLFGVPIIAEILMAMKGLAPLEFSTGELKDPQAFAFALKQKSNPVSAWLSERSAARTVELLESYNGAADVPTSLQQSIVQDLNLLMKCIPIYDVNRFQKVSLRPKTKRLLNPNAEGEDLALLNRLLLEDAFPCALSRKSRIEKYPSLPSSLKWLYFSSLSYAIGIALYQFFCPAIIKTYEHDTDYLLAERDIHGKSRPDRKLEIMLTNLAEGQTEIKAALETLIAANPLSPAQKAEAESLITEHYDSCIQRYLLNEYARQNSRWWAGILLSGLCYAAGTVVMLWLLGMKSIKVFWA